MGRPAHGTVEIAIVGGSTLYRESLRRVLDDSDGLSVVATAASLEDGAGLVERHRPDILVVDPGEATVVACSEAGVVGYLPRETTVAELVEALEQVATGEPPPIVETLARWHSPRADRPAHSLLEDLTRREREVVELVRLGLSNKQIAERLFITVATVKSHVHSILGKLNLERRAEVAALLRDAEL
ncbi:MAG TPA: response regulator transcription factor [Thermoleophilaceae bacterium]|jgi:DNA-binding NarL/FixJ family response regulator